MTSKVLKDTHRNITNTTDRGIQQEHFQHQRRMTQHQSLHPNRKSHQKEMYNLPICSPPNCNSMFVLQMFYKKINGYYILNIMVDGDYTFTKGQKVKLGGFGINNLGWGVLNNIHKDNSHAYIVDSFTALPANNNNMCNYWCDKGDSIDSCSGKVNGPFLPADTDLNAWDIQKCIPTPGSSSKCFSYTGTPNKKFPMRCPKYSMVSLHVPKSAISIPYSKPETIYNYIEWDSAGYIAYSWNYEGVRYNDETPTCYNNTTTASGDSSACMSCLDGWGPGEEELKKLGYKNLPPMGMCGRRKNLYPINLALNETNGTRYYCKYAFGMNSELNRTVCQDGSNMKPTCSVCDFWAYPGSQCQLGVWNRCNQCWSTAGQNDQTNFKIKCGGIPDNTSTKKCTNVINSVLSGTGCNAPTNLLATFP